MFDAVLDQAFQDKIAFRVFEYKIFPVGIRVLITGEQNGII